MVIGIIGGIGSGKSIVSGYLKYRYNFKALNSDAIAKEMEQPGHILYKELVDSFGKGILIKAENESEPPIDKEAFASLIYSDEELLNKANSIIHPAVIDYINKQIKESGNFVIETALPYPGFKNICDKIWFVQTPDSLRIKRLMESRGYTRDKSISIIKTQMKDEQFKAISDKVLYNSSDVTSLIRQVDEIMQTIFRPQWESK